MQKKICTLVLSGVLLLVISAFINDSPRQLFLLGDSISLQYGPDLERFLIGKYKIEIKSSDSSAFKNLDIPVGANGGDSRMVLNFLKQKTKEAGFKPDVLLLNCGLHDVKRDPVTHEIAINEKEYRQNLENIYKLVSGKKIPMIWIRTTGVIDSLHRKNKGFDRYLKDIEKYNSIASEVFSSHHIPEIDLFSFTAAQGSNRFADHAHYSPEVRVLQAAYIAGFLDLWNNRR
ncbi:MAG TPA: SGNH/GDSL hydrolase family protein [Pedobacter sp.]|uniref:SGNH/GDSL hydrolase family protein n=1 Tax=Pedobacter sp. TaxID=1411316 RepID=UPI002C4CB934|nr:SGNH/GDSL hydrolase family protein [Pedobacter sp.]HMI03566.1 SGNH/GDSL hydrolase family protein [Pedobacter sp.]